MYAAEIVRSFCHAELFLQLDLQSSWVRRLACSSTTFTRSIPELNYTPWAAKCFIADRCRILLWVLTANLYSVLSELIVDKGGHALDTASVSDFDLTSTPATSTLQSTHYICFDISDFPILPASNIGPPRPYSDSDEDAPCWQSNIHSRRHRHVVIALCITYRYRTGAARSNYASPDRPRQRIVGNTTV